MSFVDFCYFSILENPKKGNFIEFDILTWTRPQILSIVLEIMFEG